MKKITYIAAAALSLAACTKAELAPEKVAETSGKHNIEVAVTVGEDTKASFDGSNFIQFASGDRFYGFIAKKDEPRKGIVHSNYQNPGEEDYDYYSSFTIADYKAEHPVFNGHLYCIEEKDFADEYCFYGLFPYTASYYGSDITNWPITLKQDQSRASQTSWDGSADVMIMQPSTISTAGATQDKLGDYSCIYSGTVANFAHLFGFAKISFAGIPAKYADQVVKSVQIQAVGDNKDLTGRYYVDLTTGDPNQELGTYSPSDYAKITSSDKIKIGDFKAWFVLKPGTYDVKIRVSTLKADFVFDRQGLVIERSKIAEPTVNYKDADVTETHELILADGETWNANFRYSSDFISNSSPEKEWGPTAKKMVFSLSYPGSTNNNYGTYLGDYSSGYVQGFAYQNITGGKVVLSSATAFSGVSMIKTKFGIYTEGVTADFNVSLDDEGKVTDLGTVKVTGDNSNLSGDVYYFANPENKKGELVITVSNFSDTNCRPYLAFLEVNPLPEIIVEENILKCAAAAANASITCSVKASSESPAISVSEDAVSWLSASYSDGKINYTVAENTGKRRIGVITAAIGEKSNASVTVIQAGTNDIEYKLTLTPKIVYDLIKANEAAGTVYESGSAYPLTIKLDAVGKNDPSKKLAVTLDATDVICSSSTEEYTNIKGKITSTVPYVEISKITISSTYYIKESSSDINVKFSSDGEQWTSCTEFSHSGAYGGYTSVVTNSNPDYTWFQFQNSYFFQVTRLFSLEVEFVAD